MSESMMSPGRPNSAPGVAPPPPAPAAAPSPTMHSVSDTATSVNSAVNVNASAATAAVINSANAEAVQASTVLATMGAVSAPTPMLSAASSLPAYAPLPTSSSAIEARNKAEAEYRTWEAQAALQGQSPPRHINLGGPAPTAHIPHTPVAVPLAPAMTPVEDILRQAEVGLLATERRVRSEADQLEATRKSHLLATEAQSQRMRNEVLQDIEQLERQWNEKKTDDIHDIELMRQQVADRETRLRVAEAEHQEEVIRADDDIRRRALTTEEARRRTTQALEQRLRAEILSELAPKLRIDIEKELTERITHEVQADLHKEFQVMCGNVRVEVDHARLQMHAEIEAALLPKVEARLLPDLVAKAEAQVQNSIVTQLQETANSASRLRDELKLVATERDHFADEIQNMTANYKQEMDAASDALFTERQRAQQLATDLASAQEKLNRFEEERKLYPLLKEVESMPAPWAHVNMQLDVLKKENSHLQADAQFSAKEIEMLRKQIMENMGQQAPANAAISPQRMHHGKQLPATPAGMSTSLPLMESVMSRQTKCGDRSFSFSPQTQHGSVRQTATPRRAPTPQKRVSSIPHKNRFRHTPVKEAQSPTFALAKGDRDRIFFAEMEQLKAQSEKEAAKRKIKPLSRAAASPRGSMR